MAERSSLIQQVSSITGCNHYQAQTVLERSNWNAERAMNSYFDDPPPERPAVNTTIAPFLGAPHDSAAVSWDVPNNPAYAPPPGPPPASNPNWGANNKDVIDLTNDGDPDEDLRRAMAASLQDHQSQQAYRPPAAPSSTVGVSCTTGSSSAQHAIAQLRSCALLWPIVDRSTATPTGSVE